MTGVRNIFLLQFKLFFYFTLAQDSCSLQTCGTFSSNQANGMSASLESVFSGEEYTSQYDETYTISSILPVMSSSQQSNEPTSEATTNIRSIEFLSTQVLLSFTNLFESASTFELTSTDIFIEPSFTELTSTDMIESPSTQLTPTDLFIEPISTELTFTDQFIEPTSTELTSDLFIEQSSTKLTSTGIFIEQQSSMKLTSTNIFNLLTGAISTELISTDITSTDLFIEPSSTELTSSDLFIEPSSTEITSSNLLIEPSSIQLTSTDLFIEPTSTELTSTDLFIEPSSTELTSTDVFIEASSTQLISTDLFIEPSSTELTSTDLFIETSSTELTSTDLFIEPSSTELTSTDLFIEPSSTQLTSTDLFIEPSSTELTSTDLFIEPSSTELTSTDLFIEPSSTQLTSTDLFIEPSSTELTSTDLLVEPSSTELTSTNVFVESSTTELSSTDLFVESSSTELTSNDLLVEPSATELTSTDLFIEPSSTELTSTDLFIEPSSTQLTSTDLFIEPSSTELTSTDLFIEPSSTELMSTDLLVEPSSTELTSTAIFTGTISTELISTDVLFKSASTELFIESSSSQLTSTDIFLEPSSIVLISTIESTSTVLTSTNSFTSSFNFLSIFVLPTRTFNIDSVSMISSDFSKLIFVTSTYQSVSSTFELTSISSRFLMPSSSSELGVLSTSFTIISTSIIHSSSTGLPISMLAFSSSLLQPESTPTSINSVSLFTNISSLNTLEFTGSLIPISITHMSLSISISMFTTGFSSFLMTSYSSTDTRTSSMIENSLLISSTQLILPTAVTSFKSMSGSISKQQTSMLGSLLGQQTMFTLGSSLFSGFSASDSSIQQSMIMITTSEVNNLSTQQSVFLMESLISSSAVPSVSTPFPLQPSLSMVISTSETTFFTTTIIPSISPGQLANSIVRIILRLSIQQQINLVNESSPERIALEQALVQVYLQGLAILGGTAKRQVSTPRAYIVNVGEVGLGGNAPIDFYLLTRNQPVQSSVVVGVIMHANPQQISGYEVVSIMELMTPSATATVTSIPAIVIIGSSIGGTVLIVFSCLLVVICAFAVFWNRKKKIYRDPVVLEGFVISNTENENFQNYPLRDTVAVQHGTPTVDKLARRSNLRQQFHENPLNSTASGLLDAWQQQQETQMQADQPAVALFEHVTHYSDQSITTPTPVVRMKFHTSVVPSPTVSNQSKSSENLIRPTDFEKFERAHNKVVNIKRSSTRDRVKLQSQQRKKVGSRQLNRQNKVVPNVNGSEGEEGLGDIEGSSDGKAVSPDTTSRPSTKKRRRKLNSRGVAIAPAAGATTDGYDDTSDHKRKTRIPPSRQSRKYRSGRNMRARPLTQQHSITHDTLPSHRLPQYDNSSGRELAWMSTNDGIQLVSIQPLQANPPKPRPEWQNLPHLPLSQQGQINPTYTQQQLKELLQLHKELERVEQGLIHRRTSLTTPDELGDTSHTIPPTLDLSYSAEELALQAFNQHGLQPHHPFSVQHSPSQQLVWSPHMGGASIRSQPLAPIQLTQLRHHTSGMNGLYPPPIPPPQSWTHY